MTSDKSGRALKGGEILIINFFAVSDRNIVFSHEGVEIRSLHADSFGGPRYISIACIKSLNKKCFLNMSESLFKKMLPDNLQFIYGFGD